MNLLTWSVGLSIQNIDRSASQEAHYHAGVFLLVSEHGGGGGLMVLRVLPRPVRFLTSITYTNPFQLCDACFAEKLPFRAQVWY